jgi:predicted transglutaminase-like cysteine proteinase
MMRLFFSLAAIVSALLWGSPLQAAAFGSTESFRVRLGGFPKWTAMLERNATPAQLPIKAEIKLPDSGGCIPNPRFNCPGEQVSGFIISQRNLPRTEQLDAINRFFNTQPYVTDIQNWGVPDYWAAVREFLARNGDCEDYAIAKYMTLKQLGWSVDDLRIIIVQDENLNVPHAILTAKLDGKLYVLDNQIAQVIPDTAIIHYRPFYSLNDGGFWVHIPRLK